MGDIQYPTIDIEGHGTQVRPPLGVSGPEGYVPEEIAQDFDSARALCIKIIGSHLDFDKYSSCPSAACDAVIYCSQFILEIDELHEIIRVMFKCLDDDITIETEKTAIDINHNNTWHVGGRYSKSFKNLKGMLECNGRRVIGVYIRGQSLREVYNKAYREICSFGVSLDFVITGRDFIP